MDFDKALKKINDMSPEELEAVLRETMVESGIEVQNGSCRFVWDELKAEDCEI